MWWCTAAVVASGRLRQSHRLNSSLCGTLRVGRWRDGRVGRLRVCEWAEGQKGADRSHHLRIYTSQTFVYDCVLLWTKRAARQTILYFPRVSREYKAINPEMLGKYSDFLKVLCLRGLPAHSSWVTDTHNVSKTTPQKNKIPGDPLGLQESIYLLSILMRLPSVLKSLHKLPQRAEVCEHASHICRH